MAERIARDGRSCACQLPTSPPVGVTGARGSVRAALGRDAPVRHILEVVNRCVRFLTTDQWVLPGVNSIGCDAIPLSQRQFAYGPQRLRHLGHRPDCRANRCAIRGLRCRDGDHGRLVEMGRTPNDRSTPFP